MRNRAIIGAVVLIGTGVFLGGTVLREQVANARSLAQAVIVSNTPAQAVPVREQNLDANNNVKVHEQGTASVNVTNSSVPVHEQGTANVNVTNSSLSVAEPAPIVAGGGVRQVPTQTNVRLAETTATALSIRMTSGIQYVAFNEEGNPFGTPVQIAGPDSGGNASVVLSLTRPVRFNAILCIGATLGSGDYCSVSWVGD